MSGRGSGSMRWRFGRRHDGLTLLPVAFNVPRGRTQKHTSAWQCLAVLDTCRCLQATWTNCLTAFADGHVADPMTQKQRSREGESKLYIGWKCSAAASESRSETDSEGPGSFTVRETSVVVVSGERAFGLPQAVDPCTCRTFGSVGQSGSSGG